MESIEAIVEATLNSLDNVQRAKPRPFLFSRLQAKIERSNLHHRGWFDTLFLRPSSALLTLGIAVALNMIAIYFWQNNITTKNSSTHSFSIENEIAREGFFDIENTDSNEDQ